MHGNQYNIALLIFFIPYILFEIPSNIFIRRLKPSNWISLIMLVWAIATICQGLCHNFGGLLACRIVIGLAEAGFIIAYRCPDFTGSSPVVSTFSPCTIRDGSSNSELYLRFVKRLISGLVLLSFNSRRILWWPACFRHCKHEWNRGQRRLGLDFYVWSLNEIMLTDSIEGLVTAVAAIASKWAVCDFPEDCRFLTEEERAMLLARIKVDTADTHMDHLTFKTFIWIMKDWKIYCSGFMYLTCVTTSYSIALFLPTILKNMVNS
jgi:MFS family permease